MALLHVVMLKVNGENPEQIESRVDEIFKSFGPLPEIPSVRNFKAYRNEINPATNWNLTVIAELDDAEGLAVYATHPLHLESIELVKKFGAQRAGTDTYI